MEKMILSKQISDICEVANVSCVIRVTCKDKILHSQSVGYACRETKTPFSEDSMFTLYSMSKPFCATGLLLLADQGLVDLDAHPGRYVPEAKGFDSRVTVRHLPMYHSKLVDPTDFVTIILEIAKMYGNPTMSVERNGIGAEVCNKLYYDFNYPHFVNFGVAKSSSKNFRPGVISTNNVKAPAVVNMKSWLCNNWSVKMHDRRFVEELGHFQKKTNNVWQAERGYHDDIVMATVWALNVLRRELVEDYFIVEEWTAQKMPVKVYSKFTYEIDPLFKSENIHEDVESYTRMPAILFGSAGFKYKAGGPFDNDIFEASREELELMGWREVEF